jgi:hypothetical protein
MRFEEFKWVWSVDRVKITGEEESGWLQLAFLKNRLKWLLMVL